MRLYSVRREAFPAPADGYAFENEAGTVVVWMDHSSGLPNGRMSYYQEPDELLQELGSGSEVREIMPLQVPPHVVSQLEVIVSISNSGLLACGRNVPSAVLRVSNDLRDVTSHGPITQIGFNRQQF